MDYLEMTLFQDAADVGHVPVYNVLEERYKVEK
jgi:hypothetical protein